MSSQKAEQAILEQQQEQSGLGKTENYRFDRARVYVERVGRQAKMEAIRYVLKKLKKWHDLEPDAKRQREIKAQMKLLAQQYKQIRDIEIAWDKDKKEVLPPKFVLDLDGKIWGTKSI
jgi:hypothetical protein